MLTKQSSAVTEVISLILVFGLMTSAISAVMLWGTPYMDEKKAEARANSALNQLNGISDILKDDVISQGINNSSVDVKFTFEYGNLYFNSDGDRFIIYYSLDSNFDFNVSGLEKSEDDPDDDEFNLIIEEDPGDLDELNISYLYDGSSETKSPPSGLISATQGIFDVVRMDIKDSSGIVVGRIWLFDTGSITYKTSFSQGTFNVILENGAVVSGKDNNGYLSNKPTIYNRAGLFVMRIIQIKPKFVTSGGTGKITYKINFKLNESFIREKKALIPKCLKMQISGNDASVIAWKNYFKLNHGFDIYTENSAKGTIYTNCNKEFTLTHSICNCTMMVEG